MAGFYLLSLASVAFTVWMAVTAVRRGHTFPWLWIILFFAPIGGIIYLLSHADISLFGGGAGPRKVTREDVRHAQLDAKRLDSSTAWTQLAGLLRARREFRGAADAAREAVARDPASVEARYELGLALLGMGSFTEAAASLEQVVAKNRSYDSDDALFALARAQDEAGDVPAALRSLEELAGRRGRSEILLALASVQARTGNREAAAVTLRRLIEEAEYVPSYLQRSVRPWVKKARQSLRQLGC